MLHKYRQKKLVEAEQFDGSDEMIVKYDLVKSAVCKGAYVMPWLSGPTPIIRESDWIITNSEDGYQRIDDDIFRKTYERCD